MKTSGRENEKKLEEPETNLISVRYLCLRRDTSTERQLALQ